jgi:hypothetical protein
MMAPTKIMPVANADRAIEAKAAQVGADILAQYRQLAMNLRQKGWDEVSAMGAASDASERASRRCAFQLYGTAASELDDIIADLLDSLDRPFMGAAEPPILLVLDGGKAETASRDGNRR